MIICLFILFPAFLKAMHDDDTATVMGDERHLSLSWKPVSELFVNWKEEAEGMLSIEGEIFDRTLVSLERMNVDLV